MTKLIRPICPIPKTKKIQQIESIVNSMIKNYHTMYPTQSLDFTSGYFKALTEVQTEIEKLRNV